MKCACYGMEREVILIRKPKPRCWNGRRPGFPSFPTGRSLRPNSRPLNATRTRTTNSTHWTQKCLRS